MASPIRWLAPAIAVVLVSIGGAAAQAQQQYPAADKVAAKVIAKYQGSSCEQLAANRGQAHGAGEQKAIQLLKQDPGMRAHFLNKVAAPIANKMFECGMIP